MCTKCIVHYVNRGAAIFSLAVQLSMSSVAVTVQSRLVEVQRGKCRFLNGLEGNQQDQREMIPSSILDGKSKKENLQDFKSTKPAKHIGCMKV